MNARTVITLRQVCDCFNIDFESVRELAEFGLYPVVSRGGETGIEARYLEKVGRIISLYQTLGINKEGIEIILDLREAVARLQARVDELQGEVERLKALSGFNDPDVLKALGLLVEITD